MDQWGDAQWAATRTLAAITAAAEHHHCASNYDPLRYQDKHLTQDEGKMQ